MIKCKKHNVCQICGISRELLKEAPWGNSKGFTCVPCADKQHEKEKAKALNKMDNIKCPYCDLESYDSQLPLPKGRGL